MIGFINLKKWNCFTRGGQRSVWYSETCRFHKVRYCEGVRSILKEVRRGQVSLSLLRHWAWTRERAKKKREEKKRGWCAFLTCVLRDREVTSHALKTHSTFQHTHSQAIHPSIPTSLHHIIIPPLSALAGLSPADRTVPAVARLWASAITERVMLGLHRCARCRVLPHGNRSPQTGLHAPATGCSFIRPNRLNNWLHGYIRFPSFWLSSVNEDLAT